ncbi:hypothetical protein BDV40DRAFT_310439 [Aspergillus tamarii]|uniref:Uncharacterized protein n=1 Tax=Aspergillus tamarii TaxID=41984 RepID=A0A5N6UBD9_ASPTM|nr:hypothetical protein BDV40DRAFT_310439 [Aspergillus tamarii]
MGNFRGFYCHVQGMMNLLVEWRGGAGDVTIKPLVSSWMQTQYAVWWACAYFTSLDIHQQLPSIPLPISLKEALSIMCESHRLNFEAVLQHFREVAPEEEVKHEINQGYAECVSLLCQEATKLDELLLHLPPSEQPIYEPNGTRSTAIYLQSHDAVLNYAYHVVARIMQLAGLLRELYNQATPDHKDECYKTELWVQILVEIAQGAEMRTSLTQVSWQRPNTQLPLRGMHCFRLLQRWLQGFYGDGEIFELRETEECIPYVVAEIFAADTESCSNVSSGP